MPVNAGLRAQDAGTSRGLRQERSMDQTETNRSVGARHVQCVLPLERKFHTQGKRCLHGASLNQRTRRRMQAVLSSHRRERDPQDGDASQGHDHMEQIRCCSCHENAHGIAVVASRHRSVKATVMFRVEFSFAGQKLIGHRGSKHGHSPWGEACDDACLDPPTHLRPTLSAPPRRPSPRLVSPPMSSPFSFLRPLQTIQKPFIPIQ